jgi:hypothetical protein
VGRNPVNIFELGFFLMALATAIAGWTVGVHFGGWYYGIPAAIVGLFVPALVGQLILCANSIYLNHCPPRPVCEQQRCKWSDYEAIGLAGDDFEYVCKCSRKYVSSGQRFLKIREDGGREAYKRRDGCRWEDDFGEGE